jgi:hypothetical protein
MFRFLDELQHWETVYTLDTRSLSAKYNELHGYHAGLWGRYQDMLGHTMRLEDMDKHLSLITDDFIDIAQNCWVDFEFIWTEWKCKLEKCRDELEKYWSHWGETIKAEIARLFGASWENAEVTAHIVMGTEESRGQSHPLILPTVPSLLPRAQNIMVHELIHRHAGDAGNNSLYSRLIQTASQYGIDGREYGKFIRHTLMFVAADHVLAKTGISYRLIIWEEHKVKAFRHLAEMISEYWEEYATGCLSAEEFANGIMAKYLESGYKR